MCFTRLNSFWTMTSIVFVFAYFSNKSISFLRLVIISSCNFSSSLSLWIWSIRYCLCFVRWPLSSIFSNSSLWRYWFSSSRFWLNYALSFAFLTWRRNLWSWSIRQKISSSLSLAALLNYFCIFCIDLWSFCESTFEMSLMSSDDATPEIDFSVTS